MALVVIGIGCQSAGDDAVGLHLVRALAADPPRGELCCLGWEDADALTIAHDLLLLRDPVLVVDCLDFAGEPGTHRVIEDAARRLALAGRSVSCHGFGLPEALALAESLGFCQPVDVFGVQPARLDPVFGLSEPLRHALPTLEEALRAEVLGRVSPGGRVE